MQPHECEQTAGLHDSNTKKEKKKIPTHGTQKKQHTNDKMPRGRGHREREELRTLTA
jgi:hypothetical protein